MMGGETVGIRMPREIRKADGPALADHESEDAVTSGGAPISAPFLGVDAVAW